MSSQAASPSFVQFVAELGVKLTPGQRVFASVAFDRVPIASFQGQDEDIARALFGGAVDVPDLAYETIVLAKGARTGGTYLSALRLLHLSLTVPLTSLAPGELGASIIIGPTIPLARQGLRYVHGAAESLPWLRRRILEDSKDNFVIRRPDGQVDIACMAATRGGTGGRSRSLLVALLTEASFFYGADYVANDVEIYRAASARVMPHGQCIVESTVWLESGLLSDFYKSDFGAPKIALVAHAPTRLLRTDAHTLRLVEREEQRDPENARREFGAEFMSGGSAQFFDAAAIDACIADDDVFPVPPKQGQRAFAGGDFAFRSDSSAICLAAWRASTLTVLGLAEERPQKGAPLTPSAVVDGFAREMKTYGATSLMTDSHYVEAIREHLSRNKMSLTAAPEGASGKAVTYLHLRKLIAERRIALPNHPRLRAQLLAVVSKPAEGGGLRISSPRRGGHGDLVSALVLAAWAAGSGEPTPFIVPNYGADDSRFTLFDDGSRGF